MESLLTSLEPLVVCLRARGYTVIGPTESEGAIVLAELDQRRATFRTGGVSRPARHLPAPSARRPGRLRPLGRTAGVEEVPASAPRGAVGRPSARTTG